MTGRFVIFFVISLLSVSCNKTERDLSRYETSEQYGHTRYHIPMGFRYGIVIMPENPADPDNIPWVWYAPTFHKNCPRERHEWYCERLLKAGFAIAGMDVGESKGSPEGRARYDEFHTKVVKEFGLAPKACLWPQSRGGMMLYNWAVEHPEKVQCIAGIYTVMEIREYPRIKAAAREYCIPRAQLEKELYKHNPIDRLEPLAKAGVPIFHLHGDKDEVVPLKTNSAEMVKRYTALGGKARVKVIPGKGHEEVDEFFTDREFLDFILSLGRNLPLGK